MGKTNDRRRAWKLGKQAAFNCYTNIHKEIKEAKKQKQGLSNKKIEKILNCCKSFIGCFACDQLESLALNHFPCTLIVNTDTLNQPGSHWIVIRVSRLKVEMFDSLGLLYENRIPVPILAFIQRFLISRTLKFNQRIQPDSSVLCGFYCVFFIFLRQLCSFRKISLMFNDDFVKNDQLITKFFR